MKTLHVIFLTLLLAFFLMPAVPAEAKCSCICDAVTTVFTSPGGGPGSIPTSTSVQKCKGAPASVTLPDQNTTQDCINACRAQTPTTGTADMPCYQSSGKSTCETREKKDCWCKNGKDFQFAGQTEAADGCQQTCKDLKIEFGNWNAPPATTSSAVKCPPGGIWTPEECRAQTDSSGAHIGEWIPPDGATTKGPYCYVAQNPVKLNIAIGGLTSVTLAQYVAAAYRLGLGVAAVLAVIFIMIGGFRYITAAGGSGVSGAKEMIKNAVIGLALTALSYTLLQTVNPDILSLRLPRVQIVKPCNVGVSCTARAEKTVCEKNEASSGMRCVWDITKSACYDNSSLESSALGQNGGECQKSGDGFICNDGSKCIAIDSNTYRCSQGKPCQACNVDNDCGSQSGAPGKCDTSAHVCVVADPNGQPGSYLKCGNGSCKKNTDCDSGFCNTTTGTCGPSNQGVNCLQISGGLIADQKSCASGYTCIPYTQTGDASALLWKAACCLDGNKDNCLGCDATKTIKDANGESNSDCPKTMKCSAEGKCATK